MNLFEIIKNLEKLALTQPNVRTAKDGSITDILNNNPELEYGVFVVTQNTHRSTENTDEYGLTLFYVDRLVDDLESNRLSIQSIGKEQIENVVRLFCEAYEVDIPTIDYVPFTQRFVDECAGVYAQFTIVTYGSVCVDGGEVSRPMIKFLQAEKTIDIFENGTVNVFPDEGYDGIERVIINTNVKMYYTPGDHIHISDDNVISAYGFAEEADFNDLKDKVDTEIPRIDSELKNRVKNEEYEAFKKEVDAELKKKVNNSDYDQNMQEIVDALNTKADWDDFYQERERVNAALEQKVGYVEYNEDKKNLENNINSKADAADVSKKLSDLNNAVDSKADASYVNNRFSELNEKLNSTKSELDSKINSKVSKTDYDANNEDLRNSISKKVNKSEYDAKVDEIETILDLKADWDDFESEKERVDAALEQKVGYGEYNEKLKELQSAIESKGDASDFNSKVDEFKSEIDAKVNEIKSGLDSKVDKSEYNENKLATDAEIDKKLNKSDYQVDKAKLEALIDTKADWDDFYAERERVNAEFEQRPNYAEFNERDKKINDRITNVEGDIENIERKIKDVITDGNIDAIVQDKVNKAVDGIDDKVLNNLELKTINGQSIKGTGNIEIQGGAGKEYKPGTNIKIENDTISAPDVATKTELNNLPLKTINGETIKGNGDIQIEKGVTYKQGENIEIKDNTISAPNVATKNDLDNIQLKTINGQDIKGTGNIEINTDIELKTINGESIKGSGNISTDIELKTINGQSIKGTGNIEISSGEKVDVDSQLNETSSNPVENKAIFARFKAIDSSIEGKVDKAAYNAKIAELEASDRAINSDLKSNYWDAEQVKEYVDEKLVGGVNFFVDSVDGSLSAISAEMWYGEKQAEKIRDYAFYKYDTLQVVYIPEIKSLGNSAFEGCSNLNEIHCQGKAGSVGVDAFKDVAEVGILYYPGGEDYSEWCNALPEGWSCFVEGHYLYAEHKSISIPFDGSQVETIIFYGGGDGWRVEEKSDWITVTPEQSSDSETTISITAEENTGIIRSGEIVFTDGEISYVLNVTQSGVKVPDNEIWYRTDNSIILNDDFSTRAIDNFGANLLTHTYEDGIGKLVFDGSVTKIKGFAQTNITEIMMPDTIETILSAAFSLCTKLTAVKIPDNCTEIAGAAFNGCSSLSIVKLNDKLTTIGYSAFNACPIEEWNVPGIQSVEYNSFSSDTVKSYIFNEGTETIRYQFASKPKTVIWPSTLKVLGQYADNSHLFSEFPEEIDLRYTKLETVAGHIFSNAKTKKFWFPDTLKSFGTRTFERVETDIYLENLTHPSTTTDTFTNAKITVHIRPEANIVDYENWANGITSRPVKIVQDYVD